MADIDYPVQLPLPLRNGYGLNHVSPLMRTEMQSGRARQRRKYTSVPTIASVTWTLSQPQAQVFEAWFRHDLSDGAEWFNARIRTPLGLQDYECRFADMYSGPNFAGIALWQFSAELEIRERQTLSAEWAQFPEIVAYSDLFDIALNQWWPQ